MTVYDDEFPEDFAKKARPAREVLERDFGKKNAETLIKRKVGRPVSQAPKKQVTLRIDPDTLEALRAYGPGWQTNVNNVLRDWVENRPS